MAGFLSHLIADILNATTPAGGQSLLPRWMVRPMSYLAVGTALDDWSKDDAHHVLVNEAVSLYQALSRRYGKEGIVVPWRLSSDGTQAVQVFPQAYTDEQRVALHDLGNYLQLVTMNHPGLAPVLETAYHHGYPYLIARLASGARDVARRAGGTGDSRFATRIVGQVAEALEYAHHRGLIHGALSLDDIYVDERGGVTILGVGLDQLRRELGAIADRLAKSPLTPPEVAAGGVPDKRSDVYAVAALLYLLLMGKPPAPGRPTHVAAQIEDIPEAVDKVLTRALSADPEDRYEDLVSMNWELRLAFRTPREAPRQPAAARSDRQPAPAEASQADQPRRIEEPQTDVLSEERSMQRQVTPTGFPEPLPMPEIDLASLNQMVEIPEVPALEAVEIPPAPEIPSVNWEELLRPLDVSHFSSVRIETPDDKLFAEIPDPLKAAAEAALAKEEELESQQRSETPPVPPATPGESRTTRREGRPIRKQKP